MHCYSAKKQQRIADQVASCAPLYDQPLAAEDLRVLSLSLAELVDECNSQQVAPSTILTAYAKRCIAAHAATNCLADLMFDEAMMSYAPNRPLSGVPVSIKDVVDIEGHDTTVGFSSKAHKPVRTSAAIVRLLQDAGALIHVKTTVPTGLLSLETTSDLFGRTANPYNPAFSPGGSTGGGGALLAYGGSIVEIGSDVGGSVRYPAAFCGVYGMKGSSGRFPGGGVQSCMPGLQRGEAISPMARRLDDLRVFWERVMNMRPWEYDHTVCVYPCGGGVISFKFLSSVFRYRGVLSQTLLQRAGSRNGQ